MPAFTQLLNIYSSDLHSLRLYIILTITAATKSGICLKLQYTSAKYNTGISAHFTFIALVISSDE
jgi:hypothetical protein